MLIRALIVSNLLLAIACLAMVNQRANEQRDEGQEAPVKTYRMKA